jgi:hypothetical protein
MNRTATWLWLVAGIVSYRLIFGSTAPVMEHVAGIYFSGVALLMHWTAEQLAEGLLS